MLLRQRAIHVHPNDSGSGFPADSVCTIDANSSTIAVIRATNSSALSSRCTPSFLGSSTSLYPSDWK
jgi:hypothetical protein